MPSQKFLRTFSAIFLLPMMHYDHALSHKIHFIFIPLRQFLSRNFSLKLQMYLQQKTHVNCKKVKEMPTLIFFFLLMFIQFNLKYLPSVKAPQI